MVGTITGVVEGLIILQDSAMQSEKRAEKLYQTKFKALDTAHRRASSEIIFL